MRNIFYAALLCSTALVPLSANAQDNTQSGQQPKAQSQQQQGGQIQAVQLMDKQVMTPQNQQAGSIVGVVQNNTQQFVVVEMRQDKSRVLVPVNRLQMNGQQLMLSDDDLRSAQPWKDNMEASYTPVPEQQPITLASASGMKSSGQSSGQSSDQSSGQTASSAQTSSSSQQTAQNSSSQNSSQSDQGGAQIMVEQKPAQVNVQQQPPQIIVRQAPPTIIVQQPQPEIIVRMPEPQVSVAQQQPQVRIQQPQPEVQTNQPQAMVSTEQAQPQVSYERTGEPQVQFQEAQGQPKIRIERMGSNEASGQQQSSQQQATQQQASSQSSQQQGSGFNRERIRQAFGVGQKQQGQSSAKPQQVAASDLAGMEIYSAQGEKLGTVDRILQDPTQKDRNYVLIKFDNTSDFGASQAMLPIERLAMQDNKLVVQGVTEQDLQSMEANVNAQDFPQVAQDQQINIGGGTP